MNRRLGAIEAPLHSLLSKALDHAQAAQVTASQAQYRVASADRTIEYLRDSNKKLQDKLDTRSLGRWLLFAWALAATGAWVLSWFWQS